MHGRYFFAWMPPARVLGTLAEVGRALAAETGGRAVRADELHLTLAFVGNWPVEHEAALARALAGLRGPAGDDGRWSLELAGSFRAGLAWLGPAATPAWLAALADELRGRLRAAGLPFDPKPFVPHVTVVRGGARLGRRPIPPVALHGGTIALVRSVGRAAGGSAYRRVAGTPPADEAPCDSGGERA